MHRCPPSVLLLLLLATAACTDGEDKTDPATDGPTTSDPSDPTDACDPAPTVGPLQLVDAQDSAVPFADVVPGSNPADSHSTADWPRFRFSVTDPHLGDPAGGTWSAEACAVADPSDCTAVALTADADGLVGDTAPLGELSCIGDGIVLTVWVDGHVCAVDPVVMLDGSGARLVASDCDGDGVTVADGDCDDDDPQRYPGAPELCGDSADQDCDGVGPEGTWSDALGNTGDPSDLQAALDAGSAATISLCAGSWPALSVSGDLTLVGVGGSEVVVIDAAGAGSALSTASALTPVELNLEGLRITGGDTPGFGGGIDGQNVGTLTVTDCEIDGNTASDGGGVFSAGATVFHNTSIHDNAAAAGGGGIVVFAANLTLDGGSVVEANTATTAAGIAVTDGTVELNDTRVSANVASGGGGGIELRGTTTLTGGEVTDNVALFGAGLRLRSSSTFAHTLTGVVASGNSCTGGGAGMSAFPNVPGTLTMSDMRFENNESGVKGGGIYLEGPLGGGEIDIDLSDIELVGNVATEDGGGIWAKEVHGTMRDFVIDANTAWHRGGGMALKSAIVTVETATFTDNVAADPAFVAPDYPSGGALSAEASAEVELVDVSFDGHSAERGGTVLVDGRFAEVSVVSGAVTASSAASIGAGAWVTFGVLQGCDPAAVAWSGDIAWTDGGGLLQSFTPATGCFTVDGNTPSVSDTCACP